MNEIGKELAAALVAAQQEMPIVPKTGHNKTGRGYFYSTLEDIHSAIAPVLKKYPLALVCSVTSASALEGGRKTKAGDTHNAVLITGSLTVIHGPTGQYLTIEGAGEGQDFGDKSVPKATTGMRKYLLCQMFHLVTSDDPERDERVDGGNGGGDKPPKASDAEPSSAGDDLDELM